MSAALVLPVPGARMPPAGAVTSYGYQRSASHKHRGVDLAAPVGSPVLSVSDGKVVHAATKLSQGYSGYGRVVVIQASDDGPWFLYAHLDQVGVGAGSVVSVGQQIGTVGRTCYSRDDPTRLCAGGAHLHFEASPRPYPQGAEAPRLDPARFVGTDGGFLRPLAFGAGAGAVLALAAAAGVWWLAKGRDA